MAFSEWEGLSTGERPDFLPDIVQYRGLVDSGGPTNFASLNMFRAACQHLVCECRIPIGLVLRPSQKRPCLPVGGLCVDLAKSNTQAIGNQFVQNVWPGNADSDFLIPVASETFERARSSGSRWEGLILRGEVVLRGATRLATAK